MLISEEVHIWREPGGDYHIEWQVSDSGTEVTVESLAATGDLQLHYDAHPGPRARLVGLPPARRHFFRLRDQHGTEVVATERRLGMEGAPNFRDFGGYRTGEGRQVKWGFLFRSGHLAALSAQDVELLASLQLDLVFDFRRVEEQESELSRLPPKPVPQVVSLPIIPGSNSRFFEQAGQQSDNPAAMFEFMQEINREFAGPQAGTYSRMFREILAAPDARFLVHCAAGKDRTGFAAAIILLALGVPREVVMRDYLLTARYFKPERELDRLRKKYQLEHMVAESILPMLEVHEDYLAVALRHIDENYSSLEEYLEQALGVGPAELAQLRARYLE
ncbi:MAG: tyrosine-protein phosphatase [Pseudomonadales bacterium]|nr:tyrosine-protein phosphatase [Halioglobus sp.]MCP5190635.1 tyrosine-protein phosphatase [Pseudomonadales bacterium]